MIKFLGCYIEYYSDYKHKILHILLILICNLIRGTLSSKAENVLIEIAHLVADCYWAKWHACWVSND
jgi:hypothetical protein